MPYCTNLIKMNTINEIPINLAHKLKVTTGWVKAVYLT
ncbi:hypothetical protein B879_03231 [Cecembia lonarensis LW9]|uniref:Uncharacterized protein n=1 Tax=Cecembia lonarensis (strain CCUG 58316 / KCTC 22772 / LW9) TaxID=1225176 RepID=K1KVH1_CECL9|nr:hypothetical protein B879_03231 [Cecembia lonarensis LW9]